MMVNGKRLAGPMDGQGTVYLAGPIRGATFEEAVTWRSVAANWLLARGVRTLSPMRGKGRMAFEQMGLDGTIRGHFGTPKGITTRDRFDLARADVVLVNFLGADTVSIGTCVEFGWADMLRIPVVMVIDPPKGVRDNLHHHAMLYEIAGYVTYSLNEGLQIVMEILG